jgi:phosphoribosylglycinamide formyltransferase-1
MNVPALGVLVSGRGSNLQSLIDTIEAGELDARIAIVLSNRSAAPGLDRARAAGLESAWVDPRAYPSREAYDLALVEALRRHAVDLVCLAGYMRLLSPAFVDAFPSAILNIHPSLLPSFPGLDAQRQALEHGVRVTGATVHLVTAGLDDGPIVAQAAVAVRDDDTVESLSARVLEAEHRLYPTAVRRVLAGGWSLEGRRVVWR